MNVLATYLESLGVRAAVWSRTAGIPHPILSRYLSGKRGISLKTAAKIVAATNGQISFEDLTPSLAGTAPGASSEGREQVRLERE